jgi:hypothetical protein
MPELSEAGLEEVLAGTRRALLVEPNYKRKYIPLGLAKIATRIGREKAEFCRHYEDIGQDVTYVTSLFTYDIEELYCVLDAYAFIGRGEKVVVGGVAASLMSEEILRRYPAVHVFRGCTDLLDECVPCYDIDYGVDEKWLDFSFTFTSRGCPNRCAYCAVHRIETDHHVIRNWREHIVPGKKVAMISDNNLSSHPGHMMEVLQHLGRTRTPVVFDNGFDCKLVTEEMAAALAGVRFHDSGLRFAFDRIEEDGTFQAAIEKVKKAGVPASKIMAYVLYNFNDYPSDADYRMRECVRLGIRPYPQRYVPLNKVSRGNTFVGRHWTEPLARSFRYYWLMAGFYTKMTFREFVDRYRWGKMTEDDMKAMEARP